MAQCKVRFRAEADLSAGTDDANDPKETRAAPKTCGICHLLNLPISFADQIAECWESTMKYDLPKPPDGYRTDLALIIAPYFDLWFGSRIVTQLKPSRVRFVVDDGARHDELEQLRQECGARDIRIALGRASGIMHLKGYYLEFIKLEGRSQCKRRFVLGSANATEAAFSGKTNAELIAEVDLSDGKNDEIPEYLTTILCAVEQGKGLINARTTQATKSVPKLFLPSFQIRAMGPAPGFDAWLQRGCLAAKYRDAQQFMTTAVMLKKALPPGAIASAFQAQGLIQEGARNVVRYPYFSQLVPEHELDDDAVVQWKARYCVWTHLRDWLSEECYNEKRDLMVSKAKPERQARIQELLDKGNDPDWRNEQKDLFLGAMNRVWEELSKTTDPPSDYLKGNNQGIDRSHYGAHFERKVTADSCWRKTSAFVTGISMATVSQGPEVPTGRYRLGGIRPFFLRISCRGGRQEKDFSPLSLD